MVPRWESCPVGIREAHLAGRALRSDKLDETLLPKRIALPVFASDALSSNAYATQEILVVLALGGASLYTFGPDRGGGHRRLLRRRRVLPSERPCLPVGGGDYEVVSTNIGPRAGGWSHRRCWSITSHTVAVSISAGVASLASISDFVADHTVAIALLAIVGITFLNLRGVREAGALFAIPTYLFMLTIGVMVITAVVKIASGEQLMAECRLGDPPSTNMPAWPWPPLIARAFRPAPPRSRASRPSPTGYRPSGSQEPQRATTLRARSDLHDDVRRDHSVGDQDRVKVTDNNADLIGLPAGQQQKTVIVQIAQAVFGNWDWAVVIISISTALILVLAANTAFNGFPVLGSVLGRDGYLPRQLHTRGDRLAYSNGILALATMAAIPCSPSGRMSAPSSSSTSWASSSLSRSARPAW